MKHHLLAFTDAVVASQANLQISAIPDDVYFEKNGRYQMPEQSWLLWGGIYGLGATGGRVNTPSTRLRGFPQLWPINRDILPLVNNMVLDMRHFPLKLREEEDLEIDVSTDATAGPNDMAALVAICQEQPNYNVNVQDLRWIVASAAPITPALGWSPVSPITIIDPQESGRYNVYGMVAIDAAPDTIAARLVFRNQTERPGCPVNAAYDTMFDKLFTGGLGLWGQYDTYNLPQLQALGDAGGTPTLNLRLLVAKAS